tara:strand:+ start:88 stop:708 length:621 start_codon:yes stop_codon:yes gene_type:complete
MKIEIKRSKKPIKYEYAINFLEKRLAKISQNKSKELIWILTHPSTYTAGTSYNKNEIIDKSIKIVKTNRGGKITWHGPGQIVCYLVINLNNRGKDIRKFLNVIEKSIIQTLLEYKIKSFSDRKNIGIWVKHNKKNKKIAAIGIRIKKWITYHGFSLNINNSLNEYDKIIPCGIKNKEITNLVSIKKQNYKNIKKIVIKNLIKNLQI